MTNKLGLASVVLLGINSIIGAGIFLTPGAVIKIAGPWAPLAYVLAGVFAAVLAVVFATAARYVKTNGAAYAYATAAFGQRIGIYVGVTKAIAASIALGLLATLFVSTLLRVAFPAKPWDHDTELFSVKTLTFLLFIGVLLTINLFGNRMIKWANAISTLGKIAALLVFIAGGLWIVLTQHVNNYATAAAGTIQGQHGISTVATLTLATITALYAFAGFESIASAAEEMDAPERTLPKAIPLAILTVGVIYVSALLVAMMLGADKVVASRDTVTLVAGVHNDAFRTVVVIGALVSMFGVSVAASFGAPRVWTALSDSGVLPANLSRQNRFGVPTTAFAITALLALAFPLSLRFDNSSLTGLAVIARFIQFIIVPIALIALSRNRTEHAAVRRNAFTDKVLPVVAIVISLGLAARFDYSSIFLMPRGGPNYPSIALIVTSFVVVPAIAYVHYYRARRARADR